MPKSDAVKTKKPSLESFTLKVPEGRIAVNSSFGNTIGFTSKRFPSYSYIVGHSGKLIIDGLHALDKNAFCDMMKMIEDKGIIFRIHTPIKWLITIGKKRGWNHTMIDDEEIGTVWILTNEVET